MFSETRIKETYVIMLLANHWPVNTMFGQLDLLEQEKKEVK